MGRILQLLIISLLLPLFGLVRLVPLVFRMLAWLTYVFFLTGSRFCGVRLNPGLAFVLSGLLWSGLALLLLPWLVLVMSSSRALLVLSIAGGLWGLGIGTQVGLHFQLDAMRQPDLDSKRQFGLPHHLFGGSRPQGREKSVDELLREGIILGETGEDER